MCIKWGTGDRIANPGDSGPKPILRFLFKNKFVKNLINFCEHSKSAPSQSALFRTFIHSPHFIPLHCSDYSIKLYLSWSKKLIGSEFGWRLRSCAERYRRWLTARLSCSRLPGADHANECGNKFKSWV